MTKIQESLSFDTPLSTNAENNNKIVSLNELLGYTEYRVESPAERAIINRKLREYLTEVLDNECLTLMSIRWGLMDGHPKGLDETAQYYKERYPDKLINKSKVKQIEVYVTELLKELDMPELKELWESSEDLIAQGG